MSVKFSTLILKVDLSCSKCNRKIKKLLCKIQDRENIRLIAYDDKNNTVTISGPFDPHCLKRKLYCEACKIIKDIQIPPPPPEKKPDPPPEKKPDPPPEKKPDPPPEKKPDPPPEKKPDPPPEKKPDPPPPEKKPDPPPAEKKPDPPPPEKKPDPPPPEKKPDPKPTPPPPEKKLEPAKSEWPPGPVCCTRPCYVGMFGGMKCASCGMLYNWTNQGPPPVMVYNQPPPVPLPRPYYYDGYGYGGHGPYGCGCGCGQPKTCQFICEDNTSQCTIM